MNPRVAEDMQDSKFRFRTIGIAAENKDLSSKYLEIYPIEITPFSDGDLVANQDSLVHSGTDASGSKYTVKVAVATSILAKWIDFNSNRDTAPDVRRGEKVLVYQFANDDKYYWETINGYGDNIRRLETVRYVYSGTKDESVKQLDATNSYYFEISTHGKYITISTSKANGEPFAYTLQLDTDNGVLCFADDAGNFVQMDSANQSICGQNQTGSFFNLIQDSFYGSVPNIWQVDCKEYIVNASDAITMTGTNNIALSTAAYALSATNTAATTTAQYSLTATTSITETSPQRTANVQATTNTGTWNNLLDFQIQTTLEVVALATVGALSAGGGAISGNASGFTVSVPITATGGMAVTGTLTANGIDVGSTHFHTSNDPGQPTSPPVG